MASVLYHMDSTVTVDVLPEHAYVTGQTTVALRILKRRQYPDNRFSDLWNIPQIARVWDFTASGYPKNVSIQDALYFGHTLIGASYARSSSVEAGPVLVGPTCDCGIVRPGSGFKWLEQNRDAR
jgi:hypothetical protein